LILVAVAIALAVALGAVLNGTRLGLVTRAVIMNENLARGLGINSGLVRFVTFSLGAGLASLAGALITPLSSVDPNMGVPWLVSAFMLVMVSGVSLVSLAIACLVLGGAQVLVSTYGNPVLGGLTIVVLAALVLRLRPQGFARE
jgi:branched-chain amino acid transport system permease protein